MGLVRDLSRSVINALTMKPLKGPFTHLGGLAWAAPLPDLAHQADRAGAASRSPLVVYEDGIPLGPPHAPRTDVVTRGDGRYTHWEQQLVFSTSDRSDPNHNGRSYTITLSPWLFRRRLGHRPGARPAPGNHQARDNRPAKVLADVRYALDAVGQFLYDLRLHAPPLAGKTVLEVGPGINYGGVMGLACYGMVPLVADRYLAPWDGAYHPRFYTLLADELSRGDPAADVRPLRALVDHGGYDDRIIRRVAEPLEELSLPTGSVDVIFSNAVLEHLFDLERSFTQLFRVTKPGGLGLHQVDFRDHCNFSRPLEYLLLGEGEFQRLFTEWHSECGNRYRAGEFQAVLEECGFEVLLFSANQHADPEYMADFLPRLRAARGSRYCDKPEKELVELSGYFRLRKPC